MSLNNIASLYSDQGDTLLSLQYYERSLAIWKAIGDKQSMAKTLYNIASTNLDLGKSIYDEAHMIYLIGNELGLPNIIEKGAALLKELMIKKGNFKEALNYYREEVLMKDSILNGENYRNVQKQQARYEYIKQSAIDSVFHFNEILMKDQILSEEKEKSKLKSIIYWSLTLCFLVISFLIIYQQKTRLKKNQMLEVDGFGVVRFSVCANILG